MHYNGKQHMWLMLLCCLIPIGALGAIFLFNVPISSALFVGLLLLCPLLHVFMMKGMMGGHGHGEETSPEISSTLTKDK